MKNDKPLKNKTIVITRPVHSVRILQAGIEEQGGNILLFPTIRIEPTTNWDACDQAITKIESFDWIIFSSQNSASYFFQRLSFHKKIICNQKIGAIGDKTASYVNEKGIPVALMPETYSAAGFLDLFKKSNTKKSTVLMPRSNMAREELATGLRKMGHRVTTVEVYRTITNEGIAIEPFKKKLYKGTIDCITFYSPSALRAFLEMMDEDALEFIKMKSIPLAAVGRTTAAVIREKGYHLSIIPQKSSDAEMVRAISLYFTEHKDH
jgi:uroporphyrinogen-III synthase